MAVALLSLVPFIYLFIAGFSLSDLRELFTYPDTATDLLRTLGLTISISVGSLFLGIGGALVVVRTDVPLRRLLTVLLTLPLAIPQFVSSYAVYSGNLMYAPNTSLVTTFLGASVVMTLSLYPYVFLACVVALRNIDPAQEEAARSLRAGTGSVLRRVILPQLRPAAAGSVLIVSLHVLAEYGAMVQLRQETLTTTIMAEMLNFGNYRAARSICLILAFLALLVLLTNRAFAGRDHASRAAASASRPPTRFRLRWLRVPTLVVTLLVPAAAVGPTIFMTLHGLFSPHSATVVDWTEVFEAGGSTLRFAAWAALVATIVGLPVSWWVSRRPSLPAHLTERSVWIAHAIPGAILALALVFLATRVVPGLYKTAALLVLSYVILYLPLAINNQRVGLGAALRQYDDVAASLGSGPLRRLFRVSLPLALPGIATGALLVGLDASKELTTTLMLLPFNTDTLATGLWETTNGQSLDFTAAAPYTLFLVVLSSIPVFLIVRRTLRMVR